MACEACPFEETEASVQAQNWACLPTPSEALTIKRETGKNWCCHEDESRPCAGFIAVCRELGIETKGAPLASYVNWYHRGEP